MSGCCENVCAAEALQERQRGTLRAVLVINAVMFVVIVVAAQVAKSSALFSDSLDNLGDAMTYGLSLMVVASGASAKAKVALIKGLLIFSAAVVVAGQMVYRLLYPTTPILSLWGALALSRLRLTHCAYFYYGAIATKT